jgi:hypothetical protein
MPSWLPTVGLLAILLLFWLERRLIGGRATLSFSRFSETFSLGCVGATLGALLLQRIVLQFLSINTASWTWGPFIEELAKAAPAAMLVIFFAAARWLSLADLVLLGLASGLGFEFVESNLRLLASGGGSSIPGLSFLFDTAPDPQVNYLFSGHGTSAAFTVLSLSIGFRFLGKNRVLKWLPGVFGFVIACFDHAMDNWKVLHTDYFFGQVQDVQQAAPWAERLYVFTLHGALEGCLVLVGLVLATWWEGRICTRALRDRREFLLPGETRPLVASEWMIALSRIKLGRLPFFQTLAWFRLRRSWALAVSGSTEYPDRADAARRLAAQLYKDREKVANPLPSDWVPPLKLWWPSICRWFKRNRWALATRVLLVLLFIAPGILPQSLHHLTNTSAFALGMIALSLLLTIPRVRAFRKQPRLNTVRMNPDQASARYNRGFLLLASLASSAVGVLNFVLSGRLLMAAQGSFISDALHSWTAAGGNPGTLAGLPGLLTTTADPPGPCDDLRNEVAKGDARIQQLQNQMGGADPLAPGGVAPPDPTKPLVTVMDPSYLQGGLNPLLNNLLGTAPGSGSSTQPGGISGVAGGGYLPPGAYDPAMDPSQPFVTYRNQQTPIGPLPDTMPMGGMGKKGPGARPRPDNQATADALLAEQAAQAQRRQALADCQKAAAAVPATQEKAAPVDLNALKQAVNDAKRQFEDLERQLSAAVDQDLRDMQNFLQGYDNLWEQAMGNVQQFMQDYKGLANDYKDLVNQFQNRAYYQRLANIADQMLQQVAMLAIDGYLGSVEQAAYLKQVGSLSEDLAAAGITGEATAARSLTGLQTAGTEAGLGGSAAQTTATTEAEAGAAGSKASAGGTAAPEASASGTAAPQATPSGGAGTAAGSEVDSGAAAGPKTSTSADTKVSAPEPSGGGSASQSGAANQQPQTLFSTADGKYYNAAGQEVTADGTPISQSTPASAGGQPAQGAHDGYTEAVNRPQAGGGGSGGAGSGQGAASAGQDQQTIFSTADGKYYNAAGQEVTADGTPISQAAQGAHDGLTEAGGSPAASKPGPSAQGSQSQGFDTVSGGGENRPPNWETQKLGQGNAQQPGTAPAGDSGASGGTQSGQGAAAQNQPQQIIFSTADGKYYNAAGQEVNAGGTPISQSTPAVDPKGVTADVPANAGGQSAQGVPSKTEVQDYLNQAQARQPAAAGGDPNQQMIFSTSDGKYYNAAGKEVTADATPISQSTPVVDPKGVTADVPANPKK